MTDPHPLRAQLQALRAEKDETFANDRSSPLTPAQRARFDGLEYFRADAAYSVRAEIEEFAQQRTVTLGTSQGGQAHFWRYGFAKFTLLGKQESLTLFLPVESNRRDTFFAPFLDKTNREQTYGGGRYLDLTRDADGKLTIDFNLAYNPYCAYNHAWSCVLPPVENTIDQPVRAGERIFPDYE